MRLAWTFFTGICFAAFILLVTSPLLVGGLGLVYWLKQGEHFNALSGESVFGTREHEGKLQARMVNVGFRTVQVVLPGDPRPRRLLLRLEVINSDIFATGAAEGRVRLDAWPLEGAEDVKGPALYTIVAPGRSATIEDETLVVERGTRRSLYALSTGTWLYDSDGAVASFTLDGERRRLLALSAAEEDLPAQSVAVLTYANPQAPMRRVMLMATDTLRARMLRSSVAMLRPVARTEDSKSRVVEIPLPAGPVRIPLVGDDLDTSAAQLPLGLALVELKPWKAKK